MPIQLFSIYYIFTYTTERGGEAEGAGTIEEERGVGWSKIRGEREVE